MIEEGQWFTFRVTATDNVGNQASAEASSHVARVRKYYYHGGQRVAMRAGDVVYYLHGDHLGSTSLTTDASGAVVARQLYHPYGTVRHREGTLPTDFGFGGQRHDGGTGLVFMHARYYHAGLGRFVSADTIVPGAGNPQDFNRYAYVRNNPVGYTDPSGHMMDPGGGGRRRREPPPPQTPPLVPTPAPHPVPTPPPSATPTPCEIQAENPVDPIKDEWSSPSGFGAYGSIDSAISFFVGDTFSVGGGWIYNRHSRELSFFVDDGFGIEVATPKILGLGISGGILIPRGYSSNDMVLGWSVDSGGGFQADAFGQLGLDIGRSWEMDLIQETGDLNPAYDPESLMQPYTDHIGLSVGVNVLPNIIDASVGSGISNTPVMGTVPLYPWDRR